MWAKKPIIKKENKPGKKNMKRAAILPATLMTSLILSAKQAISRLTVNHVKIMEIRLTSEPSLNLGWC